ncbi:hypothetical protein ABBQ38_000724 [Trebouxia sp. C0009 RCD-2024]
MQICASCQLEQALLTGKRRGCHRSVLRHRLLLVVDVSMMVHMLPLPPAASWESSARHHTYSTKPRPQQRRQPASCAESLCAADNCQGKQWPNRHSCEGQVTHPGIHGNVWPDRQANEAAEECLKARQFRQ